MGVPGKVEVHSELCARFDLGAPAGKIRWAIKLDILKGKSGVADQQLGIKPYNQLWEFFHTHAAICGGKTSFLLMKNHSPTFKSKACWSFRR